MPLTQLPKLTHQLTGSVLNRQIVAYNTAFLYKITIPYNVKKIALQVDRCTNK